LPFAQVFGPTTVNPGFTSTGEKTLLTMATSLPAGGKNIILATVLPNAAFSDGAAKVKLRIKKGDTILYESKIAQTLNYGGSICKPPLLVAIDDNPTGNDTYTFTLNITAAGTATGSVHVQGMVVKANMADWTYNPTGVSAPSGGTTTIVTLNTSFPAGSKVALIGAIYGVHGQSNHYFIGAGNARIVSGTTTVASNQFSAGAFGSDQPCWINLIYLETTSASSQTYKIQVYQGTGYTWTMYAILCAFVVSDGAFLDTGSVALTSGTQVTVGDLSTTLSLGVAVIAIAAAENTSSSARTAFNAGDVVLQKDNSASDQVSNLVGWLLEATSYQGRSGFLPIFRFDTGTSSPSYQTKMTVRYSGFNGETKILAFTIPIIFVEEFSDSVKGSDLSSLGVGIARLESVVVGEVVYPLSYYMFSGVVKLSDGTPVPNCKVVAVSEETWETVGTAISGTDGSWSIVISGEYVVGKKVAFVAVPPSPDYGGAVKVHVSA